MNIAQALELKDELEAEISKFLFERINRFESQTGLPIETIWVDTVKNELIGKPDKTISVDTRLRIIFE